jgi:hypothetical protein
MARGRTPTRAVAPDQSEVLGAAGTMRNSEIIPGFPLYLGGCLEQYRKVVGRG